MGKASKGKVKDTDHGYRATFGALSQIAKDRPYVKVGILGNTALAAKDERDSDGSIKSDAKLKLVDVATIHEFGGGRIPQRSFIRSTFDKDKTKYRSFLRSQMEQIIQRKQTALAALELLGLKMASGIKNTFTSNDWKPLSKATVAARTRRNPSIATPSNDKFSGQRPLVDTGQLRRSIEHLVVAKKGGSDAG